MSPHTNVTHAWTLAFLLAGFLSLVLLIHFQRILNGNWVWWVTPVIPVWVSLAYSETLSQKEERKKKITAVDRMRLLNFCCFLGTKCYVTQYLGSTFLKMHLKYVSILLSNYY